MAEVSEREQVRLFDTAYVVWYGKTPRSKEANENTDWFASRKSAMEFVADLPTGTVWNIREFEADPHFFDPCSWHPIVNHGSARASEKYDRKRIADGAETVQCEVCWRHLWPEEFGVMPAGYRHPDARADV